MPLSALNSSDATPLNQPLAHQLGGLQNATKFKERLQPAGRTERKKKKLECNKPCARVLHSADALLLPCCAACELCASLRCVFAHFLAVAKILTVCRAGTTHLFRQIHQTHNDVLLALGNPTRNQKWCARVVQPYGFRFNNYTKD